jgi:hypothetical protein
MEASMTPAPRLRALANGRPDSYLFTDVRDLTLHQVFMRYLGGV